jgi:hypothetical protein
MMRRKAKSGLHPSMQAMRLSRWRNFHFAAGACSLGQDRRSGMPNHLPAFNQSEGLPSFRAIQTDVLKGMVSYDRAFGMRARARQRKPARPERII